MKLALVLLLAVTTAVAADWEAVHGIQAGRNIEVQKRGGERVRSNFVSANETGLVVRGDPGDQSIARADIRRVRVYDRARRVRKGLMWTLIGAGLGAGLGVAVCPGCPNEGNTSPYIGPGAAGGAALGALGFLSSPYRTVYKER